MPTDSRRALSGNFLTQLQVTTAVGEIPVVVQLESKGRPLDDLIALEARDVSLVIRPAGAGYSFTVMGPSAGAGDSLVTASELAMMGQSVKDALLQVVHLVHDGRRVFQKQITIPVEASQLALERLANAGARLFQRLFGPGNSADIQEIGSFLKEFAAVPEVQLKIKIAAQRVRFRGR